MFQLAVLLLELTETARLMDLQAAILALPGIDCGRADTVLPAQLRYLAARFQLLQGRDDLLFAESTLLQRTFLSAENPNYRWPRSWGLGQPCSEGSCPVDPGAPSGSDLALAAQAEGIDPLPCHHDRALA